MPAKPVSFTKFVDLTGDPEYFEPLGNERIAQLTKLTVERIFKSTRMKVRHILKRDKTPLDIARAVTKKFLEQTGIAENNIAALALVHTTYGDDAHSTLAKTLAHDLHLPDHRVIALAHGCAGFPKIVGEAQELTNRIKDDEHCLILNIETPDRMHDVHDQKATPIFAAGATATSLWKGPGHELLFAETEDVVPPIIPPDKADKEIFAIVTAMAEDYFGVTKERTIFRMEGDLAYTNGAALIEEATRASLKRVIGEFGHRGRVIVVPHQPNARMIKGFEDMTAPQLQAEHAGEVTDLHFVNGMEGMGNTVSATIPSVLARIDSLGEKTVPRTGDVILIPAAGICVANPGKKMSVGRGALRWNPRS